MVAWIYCACVTPSPRLWYSWAFFNSFAAWNPAISEYFDRASSKIYCRFDQISEWYLPCSINMLSEATLSIYMLLNTYLDMYMSIMHVLRRIPIIFFQMSWPCIHRIVVLWWVGVLHLLTHACEWFSEKFSLYLGTTYLLQIQATLSIYMLLNTYLDMYMSIMHVLRWIPIKKLFFLYPFAT